MKCIKLSGTDNCNINDNIIRNGNNGIYLINSDNNNIHDNTIEENEAYGIYIIGSNNNNIYENIIQKNEVNGIYLYTGSNNKIYENTISENNLYGVRLLSSDNTIYENIFSDNKDKNAYDAKDNNWFYNSKGNYWDDYNNYDNNNNGIGDTPYDIPGGDNQDLYPLGYFLQSIPIAKIISITPNPATQGQTIYFYGEGITQGSIIKREWRSNIDGLLSNLEDFSYNDLSVGTHVITFKIQDNNEVWSQTDSETLIIKSSGSGQQNQAPTATIISVSPSEAEFGEEIYFSGIGSDPDGSITEFYWNSSRDGKIGNTRSFYKSNLSIGTHTISFKVKDDDNTWSEIVTTNVKINASSQINNPPIANAGGPYTGFVNDTITFNANNSYDPDENDTITNYIWYFHDETTASGITVQKMYNKTGEYNVTLRVTDRYGEINENTTIITITNQSNNQTSNGDEKDGTPGFEIVIILISIFLISYFKRKKLFKI